MLSKKMLSTLNAQIAAETYSAYMYAAMSAWFNNAGLPGAAKWMSLQVREELFHAQKFFNYLFTRDGEVKLGAIEAPPCKWKNALDAFEATLKHEQKVTGLITNLMNLAKDERDHATEFFLDWFVAEQVEEEAAARDILRKLKLASENGSALLWLDQELGARTLSAAVRNALLGAEAAE